MRYMDQRSGFISFLRWESGGHKALKNLLSFVVSVALPKISFFKKNFEIPISYESITYIATGARVRKIFFGFYFLYFHRVTFLMEILSKNVFQTALFGETCGKISGVSKKENAVPSFFFLWKHTGDFLIRSPSGSAEKAVRLDIY